VNPNPSASTGSPSNGSTPRTRPDLCEHGFVWREANAVDHVCVTPQTRTQTAIDNSQAASRRQPGGGAYGPNTCRQGFVWRQAYPGDVVCVTVDTRTQAAQDNRLGPSRLLSR
jgi:hypothetical protein